MTNFDYSVNCLRYKIVLNCNNYWTFRKAFPMRQNTSVIERQSNNI